MELKLLKIWLPVISITLTISSFVFAGSLSCTVSTTCSGTVLFKMENTSNSHAGTTSSSYPNLVCCSGVTGLNNQCTGTYGVVLRLSGDTNAHVEKNTENTIPYNTYKACLQTATGGVVSIGYQTDDCSGYDTTIASMSTTDTNAHVGNASAYPHKICGTAGDPGAQFLTFNLESNSVNFGTLSSESASTSSHAINVATNASNGFVLTVTGSTLTSGGNTISPCASGCSSNPGTEQFGINLVDNSTPDIGANPSGTIPLGAASSGYGTPNSFRFNSGDIIAQSFNAINNTTFTVSYLTNIAASTEAGIYNTNLTYVVTGNF